MIVPKNRIAKEIQDAEKSEKRKQKIINDEKRRKQKIIDDEKRPLQCSGLLVFEKFFILTRRRGDLLLCSFFDRITGLT
jgi:hypothetical protein